MIAWDCAEQGPILGMFKPIVFPARTNDVEIDLRYDGDLLSGIKSKKIMQPDSVQRKLS